MSIINNSTLTEFTTKVLQLNKGENTGVPQLSNVKTNNSSGDVQYQRKEKIEIMLGITRLNSPTRTVIKKEVPQLNKRKDTVLPQLSDGKTQNDITSGNEKCWKCQK